MTWEVRQGDALEVMAAMEAESVDAVVTDPPYGLSFMGKVWDHGIPGSPFWVEALRVAKPGAHLVAFGGTRTYHRLACAIEDAGWEIRDCLMWLYGSGFPKSLDVSKAIDKAAGYRRGPNPDLRNGPNTNPQTKGSCKFGGYPNTGLAALDSGTVTHGASQWEGWGTALKPAWEPIILARKPVPGTVAGNVLAHGTGALNVDGCRIGTDQCGWGGGANPNSFGGFSGPPGPPGPPGRWPANVLLDEEGARQLDEASWERPGGTFPGRTARAPKFNGTTYAGGAVYDGRLDNDPRQMGDSGGASRFFYTSKASSGERHYAGRNAHPTVKPVDLMRWLCRLVTPPGGLVLDPFCGSGSTGVAALSEGFRFLGCDTDPESVATARRRIAGPLFAEATP